VLDRRPTFFDDQDDPGPPPRPEPAPPTPSPAPTYRGPLCANCGPVEGPILGRDIDHAIGVVPSPGSGLPVLGIAFPTGLLPDPRGARRVFRLAVPGVDPDDRFICVDRTFVRLGEVAELR
jgi:hypothetical protein